MRDPRIHLEVIERILKSAKELGYGVLGLTHSPIKGSKGNIEYLIHLGKDRASRAVNVAQVVAAAHKELS